MASEAALIEGAGEEGGIRIVAAVVDGVDADSLLQVSDRVKARIAPGVVVLGSSTDGKVHLVASVDGQAVERGISAVELIKQIAPIVGGGGGGRATMARAGGRDPDKLPSCGRGGGERDPRPPAPGGMRVLALDYGRARTGVAISDPTGTLARPLAVVRRVRSKAGMDELLALVDEHEPERIVVGLPLTLRGEEGEQARETQAVRRASCAGRCSLPVETVRRAVHHVAGRQGYGRPDATRTRWPRPICSRGTSDGSPADRDRGPRGRAACRVRGRAAPAPRLVEARGRSARAGDDGQDPRGHRPPSGSGRCSRTAGVVDDGGRFRNYAKEQGEGADFKAGTYRFQAGTDYDGSSPG